MQDNFSLYMIVDLYYVEAMAARFAVLSEADLIHPAKGRLIDRVYQLREDLHQMMAHKFRDYLFLACCGEARHAHCQADHILPEIEEGFGRRQACSVGIDYGPSPKNWDRLAQLFDEGWSGSYGGRAWREIATFGSQYGQVPDGFYVDHVVDLQHNGGTVFDKHSALEMAGITGPWDYNTLMRWLDFKFSVNLLEDARQDGLVWGGYGGLITSRVQSMLRKYFRIFHECDLAVPPDSASWPVGATYVQFGDDEFGPLEPNKGGGYVCENCGEHLNRYEMYMRNGYPYCSDCYDNQFPICDHCGDHHGEQMEVKSGGVTEWWCGGCGYASTACKSCDDLIDDRDIIELEGRSYCPDCTDACVMCGALAPNVHMEIHHAAKVCRTCVQSEGFHPSMLYNPANDPAQMALLSV